MTDGAGQGRFSRFLNVRSLVRGLAYGLYVFFVCELSVQLIGVFGLIPGGFSKSTHVPYGRIYWSKEGFSNSIMNRHGWYYGEFEDKKPDEHRIVLIGDSFVQARHVSKDQHMGVLLESRLRADGHATDVIALGKSGVGPAYYLELMKHAHDHFDPDEYVVFVFVGNDYPRNRIDPDRSKPSRYIFYELNSDGDVTMHAGSIHARDKFRRRLEDNAGPLYRSVGAILKSYVFFPQLLRDVGRAARARLGLYEYDTGHAADEDIEQQLTQMGLGAAVFRRSPDAQAIETIRITHGILDQCREFAESTGARMKLVSIPVFLGSFYQQPEPQKWVTSFGEYDLLAPERALTEFAASHGIDFLAGGAGLRTEGVDPESVRALYLNDGVGHLTAEGHAYFAEAVARQFYRD